MYVRNIVYVFINVLNKCKIMCGWLVKYFILIVELSVGIDILSMVLILYVL